jgi:hypothetical protein
VKGFQHIRATSTKYVRGSRLLGQTEERGVAWEFGRERGAFTGAIAQKKGKLEAQPPSSARRESCGRERGVRGI